MLPGDPQWILAGHEVPTHGGVARSVRPPISQLQRGQRLAPSLALDLQIPEWLAVFAEKHMVMSHEAFGSETGMQSELPLENRQSAWAKRNSAIFSGLGLTAIDAGDPCLVDADHSVHEVDIGENECNLFRRPHAGEESELVIVPLSFAPVAVDGSNERLGVVCAEWIDLRSVVLFQTRASKTARRVILLGMVVVAEFEGSSQDADGIVVRLLAPRLAVCNRNELGVTDLMKEMPAECRAPYTIQDSLVGADCRCSQIMPRQSRLAVREELVEDLLARANLDCSAKSPEQSVVRKLLGKGECANFNLAFDMVEPLMRAPQIGFGWRTVDRRAISDVSD